MDEAAQVASLLRDLQDGNEAARKELFELLQGELLRLAHNQMHGQRRGHTLQTTALVNELYVRLCKGTWKDRSHFLAAASRAMQSILVDHARRRKARKRDAVFVETPLDELVQEYENRAIDLEALSVALERYRKLDPVMAQAVDLRFFSSLSNEQTAGVLGLSLRDYERRWANTRTWLRGEIG